MPEIGETLRETRMRSRIDISEVEQATKIRAKYLRALENEEWDLLPGPTFVKTFLRTYAEFLGLDAKLLVDEFKDRFERPTEHELAPLGSRLSRDRGSNRDRSTRGSRRQSGNRLGGPSRGGGRPPLPRGAVVGVCLLALVALLFVIGKIGGSNDGGSDTTPPSATHTTTTTSAAQKARERARRKKARENAAARRRAAAAPKVARLTLEATSTVFVCLVDARNRRLINGATLTPATPARTYRSKQLRLTLGNNSVRMKVNGKRLSVPPSSSPIGYTITPKGRHPLSAAKRPTCT